MQVAEQQQQWQEGRAEGRKDGVMCGGRVALWGHFYILPDLIS